MRLRYSRKDSSTRWERLFSAVVYSQCTTGASHFFTHPTSFVERMSLSLLFCLSPWLFQSLVALKLCSCQGAAALPESGQRRGDLPLKKDPSTNRDRNKALLDIFSKGSAFSAKAACPFPPSGSSATFPKEIFPEEKLPSLCMTKMSQSWNGLTKVVPKRQNSRRFFLLPDTKTEPMPSHRLCAYSE